MNSHFKFFQKFIAAPYLLALLGLLLPMFNISCAEQVIAEPTFYELANGLDLETALKEPAAGYVQKLSESNPKALDRYREVIPTFPKLQEFHFLYGVVGALVLASIFAWLAQFGYYASLGSLLMGILSMVAMWAFLGQVAKICNQIGMNVLAVEPATGIYCASFLILIGTAMNLASIIRPILTEYKAKKAAKK